MHEASHTATAIVFGAVPESAEIDRMNGGGVTRVDVRRLDARQRAALAVAGTVGARLFGKFESPMSSEDREMLDGAAAEIGCSSAFVEERARQDAKRLLEAHAPMVHAIAGDLRELGEWRMPKRARRVA